MRSTLVAILLIAGCSSGGRHDEPSTPPPTMHDSSTPPPTTTTPKVYVSTPTGDAAVSVEVVSTPATIERGLMFREHLPPDNGMLFLMDSEKPWSFWMHNTLIPLDMLFIKGDMTVAGIVENATPRTDDLRKVDGPSRYVLEVNGGYCAAHKITAGAKVRFEGVQTK